MKSQIRVSSRAELKFSQEHLLLIWVLKKLGLDVKISTRQENSISLCFCPIEQKDHSINSISPLREQRHRRAHSREGAGRGRQITENNAQISISINYPATQALMSQIFLKQGTLMLAICDYCGWLGNLPLETFQNQIGNHLSLLGKLQPHQETCRRMNLNNFSELFWTLDSIKI